jgi:molecular chaperone DnaJ
MATTERDNYELLGVGRTATAPEIKKAFRGLARELHPDVSEDPEAEARFKDVGEAYEVLSNPERRELSTGSATRACAAGLRADELRLRSLGDLFSAFFGDDLFGVGGGRAARPAAPTSPPRSRSSWSIRPGRDPRRADPRRRPLRNLRWRRRVRHARGHVPHVRRSRARPAGVEHRLRPVRPGAGVSPTATARPHRRASCTTCGGDGRVVEERTVAVEIPPGIHDGQRIRLGGEGHAGEVGGRAGDLYVLVRVKADPRFVREGNDLISQVDLTVTQAALGTTATVPTIDGDVELGRAGRAARAGARDPRRRHARAPGPQEGDHRLLVNVMVPRRLNDEQRRLLAEFEQTADEETYRPDDEGSSTS